MVLWVFGYGSLIWKTGFKYDERITGYIKNYKRSYTQGSIDHRGTVEKPGRTVTLDYEEGAITWGAAYRISGHEEKLTLAYLDLRERLYVKDYLDLYTTDSRDKPAIPGVLTYIAPPDCEFHLGPATLEEMASQIAVAYGPSGTNSEYLFNLESGLLQIGVECLDEMTRRLAIEVRKFQKAKSGGALNTSHLITKSHIGVECLEEVTRRLSIDVRKVQKAKSGATLNTSHLITNSHIGNPRMNGVMVKIQ